MRVLILCTGNSCRSQMAEGYLKSLDPPRLEVFSAGTTPAVRVHPMAVAVMREDGIDLRLARPKRVDEFLNTPLDFVITVCDNARESCPTFTGEVKHRLHIGFDDPAEAVGTNEQIRSEVRRGRDAIRRRFDSLYVDEILPKMTGHP